MQIVLHFNILALLSLVTLSAVNMDLKEDGDVCPSL